MYRKRCHSFPLLLDDTCNLIFQLPCAGWRRGAGIHYDGADVLARAGDTARGQLVAQLLVCTLSPFFSRYFLLLLASFLVEIELAWD